MTLELNTLETSFDLIAPRGEELVDVFYSRLFDAAPSVEPLFAHTDLRKQKSMLLATLVLLRKSLRDLEAITPKLRELGARHVAYGALPEHYPVVAEVMLDSMAEIADEAWTPEIAAAWAGALGLVAAAMLEGAEEAEVQRSRAPRCSARLAFSTP
jgi:hemoglobin-like flavoprotein